MQLRYFFFPLIFFPSITFGLLPSEIFPWAFLVSLFYIKQNFREYIIIILILIPSILIGYNSSIEVSEIFRSLFAYINVLFIFITVIYLNDKDLSILIKALKFSLAIIVLITITQYVFPQINNVLKILVPRLEIYSTGEFVTTYAGNSALSPEPARTALEIIMLSVTYLIISKDSWLTKFLKNSLLALYVLILNRSITGIFFLGVYASLLVFEFIRETKLLLISSMIILSIIILLSIDWANFFEISFFDLKGLMFIRILFETESFNKIFESIWYWSGFRFSSVLSAYLNPTAFGYGMGNWFEASSHGYEMFPFLKTTEWFILWCEGAGECGHRPTALLAAMIMEIGILPAIILLLYLKKCTNKNYDTKIHNLPENINLIYLLLFFMPLIVVGSIGNPVTPTCIGILLNLYYKNYYRTKTLSINAS